MLYRALIDGVDCGMSILASGSVDLPLFDEFGIGNACSGELSLELYPDTQPPSASRIAVQARETEEDEWGNLGVFYLDVRDEVKSKLTVEAYDKMLAFEGKYIINEAVEEWPKPSTEVVEYMCSRVGIPLDSRTVLDPSIMVEYPDDRTMREVLSSIAAAHAGNFIITSTEQLHLVKMDSSTMVDVEEQVKSFKAKDSLPPISGILLFYDDENAFMSGDESGYVLNAFCYFATQAIADSVFESLKNYSYRGFEATAAPLPIGFQLGDYVTIDGETFMVANRTFKLTPKMLSDISAPIKSNVNHEYSIEGDMSRKLKRKVQLGSKYYGVSISRQKGLYIEKTDSENVVAHAVFNTDELSFYQGSNPVFYFDAVDRKFKITAEVDITAVNDLAEQVALKLDANQVSIAISDQLQEGVEGVKIAGKNFLFDTQGLSVASTAGTTKSTLDELGLAVTEGDVTVLAARDLEVYTQSITAGTFMNMCGLSRFEKSGQDRMGCYWIGGRYGY